MVRAKHRTKKEPLLYLAGICRDLAPWCYDQVFKAAHPDCPKEGRTNMKIFRAYLLYKVFYDTFDRLVDSARALDDFYNRAVGPNLLMEPKIVGTVRAHDYTNEVERIISRVGVYIYNTLTKNRTEATMLMPCVLSKNPLAVKGAAEAYYGAYKKTLVKTERYLKTEAEYFLYGGNQADTWVCLVQALVTTSQIHRGVLPKKKYERYYNYYNNTSDVERPKALDLLPEIEVLEPVMLMHSFEDLEVRARALGERLRDTNSLRQPTPNQLRRIEVRRDALNSMLRGSTPVRRPLVEEDAWVPL